MRYCWILLFLGLSLTACSPLNPSFMFKTPANYKYVKLVNEVESNYKIRPFDELTFNFYTNDGQKLIDVFGTQAGDANQKPTSTTFIIDENGYIKLPVFGNTLVKGLTVKELQQSLEKQLSSIYVTPFVIASIVNKRLFVFNGEGSLGGVVMLKNDHTTIVEAIAMAGGITARGKAKKVKLIRGDLKNPQIELIDLSTMEGIQRSSLFVQPNDIIYVEPIPNYLTGTLTQITPVLSLLTTTLLVIQLIKR